MIYYVLVTQSRRLQLGSPLVSRQPLDHLPERRLNLRRAQHRPPPARLLLDVRLPRRGELTADVRLGRVPSAVWRLEETLHRPRRSRDERRGAGASCGRLSHSADWLGNGPPWRRVRAPAFGGRRDAGGDGARSRVSGCSPGGHGATSANRGTGCAHGGVGRPEAEGSRGHGGHAGLLRGAATGEYRG